jgi:hypothetical protein
MLILPFFSNVAVVFNTEVCLPYSQIAFVVLMNLLVGAPTADFQPIHPGGIRVRRRRGEQCTKPGTEILAANCRCVSIVFHSRESYDDHIYRILRVKCNNIEWCSDG